MNVLKPAGWAGLLCVFLGVAVGAAPQDPPDVITKAARQQLDKQFPGWTSVAAPACGAAATTVTADIDFDKSADVALVLTAADGQPHVVVIMPRVGDEPNIHDLGPLAAVPGATHLVVLPLGTAIREPGAMFDDYLSGPTFAAASCEKALMAFVWSGGDFRQRMLK